MTAVTDREFLKTVAGQVYQTVKKTQEFECDYPEYAGVDKKLSAKLSAEHVDALQKAVWGFEQNKGMTQAQFSSLAWAEYKTIVPPKKTMKR